jgi:hypothetical protein
MATTTTAAAATSRPFSLSLSISGYTGTTRAVERDSYRLKD